jgi:chemosensory pili system protein ChpA (sensor histidine kinase/response regulator)
MSRVDPSTFSWVKDEIDESIKQARLSLEAFSTSTDDTSQMRMAVAFLHQVSGTLQIVELDGAARLVNEIELVCEGLIDESIPASEENLDTLSRGVLSLSTYISQLHAGYPDSIVALTGLINELRSTRDAELVSEFDLFNPELDIYPEISGARPTRLSDENFISEAGQARKQLLATMVSWFTQKDEKQSLNTILLLFTHLKNISRFDVTSQLWWVATALTEALLDGGVDSKDKEVRRFFATLEQELKRIVNDGESALVKSPLEALLRRMLFLIGKAESRGPLVTEVVHAFELDEQVSGKPTKDTGAIFEATSPEVLQPVMKALAEELSVAEGHLNGYFDSGKADKSIDPLLSSLDKIRGAVEVINKKKLRLLVEEISHTALANDSGAIVINNNIALELAGGLLTLQNACSELDDPSSDWEEKVDRAVSDLYWIRTGEHAATASSEDFGIDIDEEGTLTDVEFSQLVKVVAAEIGTNLQDVVEKFEKYSLNMHLNEILKPIPDKLRQIEGALQILERQRAIELVSLINEQITSMAERRVKPSTEHVETTALAISAIESYAQSLQHDQPTSELIIERAMEELLRTAPSDISDRETAVARVKHIRDEADDWLRNPEDELHLATLRKDMAAICALAKGNKDKKLEKIADEVSSLVTMLSTDPDFLTDDIMTTFHQSLSILETLTGRLPDEITLVEDKQNEEPQLEEVASKGIDLGIELEEIDASELTSEQEAYLIKSDEVIEVDQADDAEAEPAESVEEIKRAAAVFDDEILDIFLEEAREIAVASKDYLQKWRADTSDENSLADLRRSFHTLKGSGRMSGAVEFGEFSWLMEELLNNVITEKLQVNDQMFALLEESLDVLPSMLDDLERHDESNIDVSYWQSKVEGLGRGDELTAEIEVANVIADEELEGAVSLSEESAEQLAADEEIVEARLEGEEEAEVVEELELVELEEATDVEVSDSEIDVDTEESETVPGLPAPLQSATVREIYTTEINKHLDDLFTEISSSSEIKEPEVSDATHRLIHTLRGSARSVGLDEVADTYESVENLLDGVSSRSLYLTKEDIDILQTAYDLGVQLLETVQQPTALEDHLLTGMSELSNICSKRLENLPNPQLHDGTIEMPRYFNVDDMVERLEPEEPEEAVVEEVAEEPEEVVVEEVAESEDEPLDELVEIFQEEAIDLLSRFHESLELWRKDVANEEASSDLKRTFHTIKGSARMTGITSIGDLAHNTESMLDEAERAENEIDDSLFDLIEEVHDTLLAMVENPAGKQFDNQADELNHRILNHFSVAEAQLVVDEVAAEQPAEVDEAEESIEAIEPPAIEEPGDEVQAEPVQQEFRQEQASAETETTEVKPVVEKKSAVPQSKKKKDSAAKHVQVRVDSELLGTLANYAGEVSIARSRIQQQVSNFKENLTELHNNIERFNKQIRELEIQADTQILSRTGAVFNEDDEEFDPLEFDRYTQLQFLSRNLSESLNDLLMIQTGMDNFAGDVELLLHEQSRLNTDLQEGLTQTRMVAFSTLMPRLRQLTRKTSRELKKPVNLEIAGGEIELDRNVIDQVVPPLEHLIRNSIAHGIEGAKQRKKQKKQEKGLLKLDISREGKDVIIEFSDDGQGLDLDRIRSKAEERGLLDKGMNPSDDHLANLIFVPGFSTADSVTQVSGRGVGMDVVQSELKKVGGSVSLATEKNVGTSFFIRLPLSMTVAQALIISSGGHRFAVPLMAILSITMAHRSRVVADASGEQSVTLGEKSYPYISLAERLGMLAQLEDDTKTPALIMNSATGPIVVGVDELVHSTEIVVKPVGVQVASLDGIEGATVLSDGEVALILDLVDLWNTRHVERDEIDQASLVAKLEEEVSPATVMVVDDSLTVRRVTERNLSKYGINTILATDGIDAMEKISEDVPDVMLVDIEMPRMDGFELTERVRDDPVYRDIPIIIITSRSGPKHRDRAMELGATLYLTKPYQELELMNAINSVLPLESSRKISAMMEN